MRWVLVIALAVLLWLALTASQGTGGDTPAQPDQVPDGNDLSRYGTAGTFAAAWAKFENTGNRYNNPVGLHGNWTGVTGHTASGEAIFDNLSDAWAAVTEYVQQQAAAHPGWSITNFFGKVLGNLQGQPVNNEQGNSLTEANAVSGFLGVTSDTNLDEFLG